MILAELADVLPGTGLRRNDFTEEGSILVFNFGNLKENNNLNVISLVCAKYFGKKRVVCCQPTKIE